MGIPDIASLLTRPESNRLDFKKKAYWDQETSGHAKDWRGAALKDILAFANTPSDEPAYIVMGVDAEAEDGPHLHNCPMIDEANLRAQLDGRTDHRIRWQLHRVTHQECELAILEVMPEQFRPNTATEAVGDKKRALPIGQIWIRRGTQNQPITPKGYRHDFGDPLQGLTAESISLVERWLEVLDVHGVPRSRVPELLSVSQADLRTMSSIAAALTPEVLDQTSSLFHVSRQWLDCGEDDRQQKYSLMGGSSSGSIEALFDSNDGEVHKMLFFLASGQPTPNSHDWSCAVVLVTQFAPAKFSNVETFAVCSHACWCERWHILQRLTKAAHDADILTIGGFLPSCDAVTELCSTSRFAKHYLQELADHGVRWRKCDWNPGHVLWPAE